MLLSPDVMLSEAKDLSRGIAHWPHGQNIARHAVNGSSTGLGRPGNRTVVDDGTAPLVLDGVPCHCATEAACQFVAQHSLMRG